MDKLERHIMTNREAFDDKELPEGHLERFETRLDSLLSENAEARRPRFRRVLAAGVASEPPDGVLGVVVVVVLPPPEGWVVVVSPPPPQATSASVMTSARNNARYFFIKSLLFSCPIVFLTAGGRRRPLTCLS